MMFDVVGKVVSNFVDLRVWHGKLPILITRSRYSYEILARVVYRMQLLLTKLVYFAVPHRYRGNPAGAPGFHDDPSHPGYIKPHTSKTYHASPAVEQPADRR